MRKVLLICILALLCLGACADDGDAPVDSVVTGDPDAPHVSTPSRGGASLPESSADETMIFETGSAFDVESGDTSEAFGPLQ